MRKCNYMKIVKNILDKITSYASVFIFIMMVLLIIT